MSRLKACPSCRFLIRVTKGRRRSRRFPCPSCWRPLRIRRRPSANYGGLLSLSPEEVLRLRRYGFLIVFAIILALVSICMAALRQNVLGLR
jgi:hypothetical protein